MGIENKFCRWIEGCLTSVRVSILVNGSPTKEFVMKREISQGDPLSPFLFLFVGEVLNQLVCVCK